VITRQSPRLRSFVSVRRVVSQAGCENGLIAQTASAQPGESALANRFPELAATLDYELRSNLLPLRRRRRQHLPRVIAGDWRGKATGWSSLKLGEAKAFASLTVSKPVPVAKVLNRITVALTHAAPVTSLLGPHSETVIASATEWARPGVLSAIRRGGSPQRHVAANDVQ